MIDQTEKQYLLRWIEAKKKERTSFISHYQELSRYIDPRRGRFLTTDRNKGDRRHQDIINSHASQAKKICANGLLSGTMSPSRQWFDYMLDDADLMEYLPVKVWLAETASVVNRVFNQSNLYNMAPTMLGEMVQFGTGAMTDEDDYQTISRFYTHTVGSYFIGQDENFRVNQFGREFEMTTEQMIGKFGLANVSTQVKNAYDRGDYDTWFKVNHIIEPNKDGVPGSPLARDKKFRSIYFEEGGNPADKDKFLRRSGYEEFPVYVPRWATTGEDVYGTDCPGMTSLGDVKMLQIQERDIATAMAVHNKPPLRGPGSLANVQIDNLPGGATLYDSDGRDKLEPVYQVNPDFAALSQDLQRTQRRIDEAYHVPLFLAITNMEGIQPRNQLELTQRNQERLLQLGPVLERLHGEFLTLLLDRTFNKLVRASTDARGKWLGRSVIPPPPPELQGRQIQPRYISSIAIAQRAAGVSPIEQITSFAAGLLKAGIISDTRKIDGDQALDEYASRVGAPPKIIVPDDKVAAGRAEAAHQAMRAQQVATAEVGTKALKNFADARAASQGGAQQQ